MIHILAISLIVLLIAAAAIYINWVVCEIKHILDPKKLTKRQQKQMSKTHRCPDCDEPLKGGELGGYCSQSVWCEACGSKFFACAWGVHRLAEGEPS